MENLDKYLQEATVIGADGKKTIDTSLLEAAITNGEGSQRSQLFQEKVKEMVGNMAIIKNAVTKDARLNQIVFGSNAPSEFRYTGTQEELDKAFKEVRIGEKVAFSQTAAAGLAFLDVIANPTILVTGMGIPAALGKSVGLAAFSIETARAAGINAGITYLVDSENPNARIIGNIVALGTLGEGLYSLTKLGTGMYNEFKNGARIAEMPDGTMFMKLTEKQASSIAGKLGGTVDGGEIKLANGKVLATYGEIIPEEATKVIRNAREMDARLSQEIKTVSQKVLAAEGELPRPVAEALGTESAAAADAVASSGCFLAGTRIMLSDGSYKNIEDMKIGDSVKSYDLSKKIIVDSNVTMTFVRNSSSYRIIEYEIEE